MRELGDLAHEGCPLGRKGGDPDSPSEEGICDTGTVPEVNE